MVERHQCDLVLSAEAMQGADRADGGEVLGGEQRGRCVGVGEQFGHRTIGEFW